MAGRTPPTSTTGIGDGGSAGGAVGGGGAAGGKPGDLCNLSFTTPLNGPDPAVVATLKDGDVLRVDVRAGTPYPSVVCVVPLTGKVAGSLATAMEVADLIECHGKGHRYSARVSGSGQPPLVQVYRTRLPSA